MILITSVEIGTYCFINYPDNINIDYKFLNNEYLIDEGLILPGRCFVFDGELPKEIKIFSVYDRCNFIFNYYAEYKRGNELAEKLLYQMLECIPKEFIKCVIKNWKEICKKDLQVVLSFEQELDSLYDNMMIRDIIE